MGAALSRTIMRVIIMARSIINLTGVRADL